MLKYAKVLVDWKGPRSFICPLVSGAPNEKKKGKGLECRFLLSHIILWPFIEIFVRANIV